MHICGMVLEAGASAEDVLRSLTHRNVVIRPESDGGCTIFVSDPGIVDILSTLPGWHHVGNNEEHEEITVVTEFMADRSPQEILHHLRKISVDPDHAVPVLPHARLATADM